MEVLAAKDDDPEGLKLLAVSDPLEQAAKRLLPLQQLQSNSLDTWIVTYDVAIRRRQSQLNFNLSNARQTNIQP